ncbi:MAG: double zinc ribbon domain-containing protein [Candidatus Heimdallarchaeaceae archaeon]
MSVTQDCPTCFRKIKTSSKFCKFCGSTLKLCSECNSINKEDDSYCSECGADIKTIDVAESYKDATKDSKDDLAERAQIQEYLNEGASDKKPQLVMWPPAADSRYHPQASPRSTMGPNIEYLDKEPTYQPKKLNYTYSKVRVLGFLGGPLPTTNVLSSVVEAFGVALALIAVGIVIFSIGMAFFQYLVFPIIAGVLGGAFLLSAPFFGIYYVSSNWLYRAFEIKRPVKLMTIIWNYTLGSLIFAILGLMLAPIFIQGGALGITFSIIGGIVYLMGLIVVPLKAYLADLVYVKAAVDIKNKESTKESGEEENKKNVEK